MNIGIIDYGAGNLQSVRNALHALERDPVWIKTPADLEPLDVVIFPGQGEFRGCIESLRERALFEPLQAWLAEDRPYFGICLGYQALFESSEEAPGLPGLAAFKGHVKRFTRERLSGNEFKIPHMGWNEITPADPSDPLWEGLPDAPHAYFVHSYFPVPDDPAIIATTTTYGAVKFASSVRSGNRVATQFHPEKSQAVGLTILKNFLANIAAPVA